MTVTAITIAPFRREAKEGTVMPSEKLFDPVRFITEEKNLAPVLRSLADAIDNRKAHVRLGAPLFVNDDGLATEKARVVLEILPLP